MQTAQSPQTGQTPFSTSPWNLSHRQALAAANQNDKTKGSRRLGASPEGQGDGFSHEQQEQGPAGGDQTYLPSLLLDALGGGRRPTSKKSPKGKAGTSKGPFDFQAASTGGRLSHKVSGETLGFSHSAHVSSAYAGGSFNNFQDDDDAPPSQSLFTMTPGDMRVSEQRHQAAPVSLYPSVSTPMRGSGASTPGSLRSVSGAHDAAGSPMDFSYSRPSSTSSSTAAPLLFSPMAAATHGGISSTPISHSSTPLKAQTTVTLMGFPPAKWRQVLDLAKTMDTVLSFRKSDDEHGNWLVVTFSTTRGVSKMREYDGQLCDGSWFLTVRLGDLALATAVPAVQVTGGLVAGAPNANLSSTSSPMMSYKPPPISIQTPKKTLSLHQDSVTEASPFGSPLTSAKTVQPPVIHKTRPPLPASALQQENRRQMETMEEDDEDVQPSVLHKIMDFFTW